ncbi:SAV_6107 family HEPN domain-containing protein [Pseudonocardia parietis]|uniref:SAV-6107-like HEPN domain-containing protein n=1 Tax=Pseudonocardia parietis TaxID=570936 RepID=A0ABS4VZH1_9PSEU|nr:SAV_6107 family HEPN domain-containing protein [Pseudonocardia parietis]MBP2369325.1 hypothetical protein [Pseudonocardia parietis]
MGRTMELDLWLPSARDRRAAPAPLPGTGAGAPARRAVERAVTDGLWPLECPAGTPAPGRPAAPGPEARAPDVAVSAPRGAAGCGDAAAAGRATPGRTTVDRATADRTAAGRAAAGRRVAAPPSRDALALLRQAADQLAEAHREPEPVRRYPAAYLAALRAGAAVLAMRARPRPRRGAPRDVWRLLAEVAPELEEWAMFFASCSRTRAAAEAGIDRLVDRRGADDLLRQAEQFVARVQLLLPR